MPKASRRASSRASPKRTSTPPEDAIQRGQCFGKAVSFTLEEDRYLIHLKETEERTDWAQIMTKYAAKFPGSTRTKGGLQVHYSRSLKGEGPRRRNALKGSSQRNAVTPNSNTPPQNSATSVSPDHGTKVKSKKTRIKKIHQKNHNNDLASAPFSPYFTINDPSGDSKPATSSSYTAVAPSHPQKRNPTSLFEQSLDTLPSKRPRLPKRKMGYEGETAENPLAKRGPGRPRKVQPVKVEDLLVESIEEETVPSTMIKLVKDKGKATLMGLTTDESSSGSPEEIIKMATRGTTNNKKRSVGLVTTVSRATKQMPAPARKTTAQAKATRDETPRTRLREANLEARAAHLSPGARNRQINGQCAEEYVDPRTFRDNPDAPLWFKYPPRGRVLVYFPRSGSTLCRILREGEAQPFPELLEEDKQGAASSSNS